MRNSMQLAFTALLAAVAGAPVSPAAAQGPPSILSATNLSGYEFLLGSPCEINGVSGKCGVLFGGWTGGTGQEAGGWTPFPGTRQGLWEADVNYTGSPDFGASVSLQGGTFDLFLKNRPLVSGSVTGGSVEWPPLSNNGAPGDIGCGAGVAKIAVYLTIAGSSHSFDGCLHDLPAGTVIPPTIWGRLQ
jgi:hypothetical protein